jgi:integrase
MAAGIEVRHRAGCKVKPNGSGCTCTPTYRATVYDKATGTKTGKSFPTEAAAKGWRRDAYRALSQGDRRITNDRVRLEDACEAWIAEARAGIITTRSGDPYKPGALYGYHQALKGHVYPTLGDAAFHGVRRVMLQDLIDRLAAQGVKPGTVQKPITALRSIYKRALLRGEIEINPTLGLKLPAVRSSRDRFTTPSDAAALVAAAPDQDRALWATAFYAGLRRGELMALTWADVDLEYGTILVARGWDLRHGPQETKNRQRRRVPIPAKLREPLAAHKLRQAPGDVLCFGSGTTGRFEPRYVQERADEAWKAAGLKRLTFHACRHTCASFAIAAGVNAKALSAYMGHSSIKITFDLYGHLMPGNEREAAALLDRYLSTDISRELPQELPHSG